MTYAIQVDSTNRINRWEFTKYVPADQLDQYILVDYIPEGNLPDYLYINGEYVYDPLPKPEQPEIIEEPTVWDELDAAYQSGYTDGYQEGVNTAYDE